MIEEILKDIGLKEKELKIYLALLESSKATASVLSYKTGLTKGNVRYICRQLVNRGLISSQKEGNAFMYVMESPRKLFFLLNEEKKAISQKEERISKIVGKLEAIINPDTILPKVHFHDGIEGIKKIYEDTLEGKKTIYAFENMEITVPEIRDYLLKIYLPLRLKNKIFLQTVTADNSIYHDQRSKDSQELRETRFFSSDIVPMELEISIYGNKTAFFSYQKDEMFAAMLESPAVAKSMKSIFDFCWKFAK